MVITQAGHNFVGAVVLANPTETPFGHPRAMPFEEASDKSTHPRAKNAYKSAQKKKKTSLVFRKKGEKGVYLTRTHRCIYEPALLPGNILWLKLENGLSIFDNETFVKNTDASKSISSFFTPFTTFWAGEWISVYSFKKKLQELAREDTLTMCEAINLNLHLQKMLSATDPMITTNQFGKDFKRYYVSVIKKVLQILTKNEKKSLKSFFIPFGFSFGEPTKKRIRPSTKSNLSPRILPGTEITIALKNVLGAGDCAVLALLQAMDSNSTFLNPDDTQTFLMKHLREQAAIKATERNAPLSTISRLSNSGQWLATDDFRYFAMLPDVRRPIFVIMDHGFEVYMPDGSSTAFRPNSELIAMLNDPVVTQYTLPPYMIYYNGINHFQTITEIHDVSPQ